MPSLATLKLIGYGLGALAVIALLAMVNGWRVERNLLRDQAAATCAVTRGAADNPKLSCKNVDVQIRELGNSLKSTTDALNRQNAAVAALSVESKRQQDEAVKAQSAAKERVKAAQGMSSRLARSAGDNQRKIAPCEPSDALEGAWK